MNYLKQTQWLPITLDEAWEFFSTPNNLNKITPEDMRFNIISELPGTIYNGLIIKYRIVPMFNIELDWVTEITHVKEKSYFVDEQRKGPYHIWHHEHHFEESKGGVLMTDILYYDIGKWIFGWLAGKLFVHKKVEKIFEYRRDILKKYFSK